MNYEIVRDEVLKLFKKKKFSLASELLVKEILNNETIKTTKEDKLSEMWIYKDGIYVPQGKSEVKEHLRKIMDEYYGSLLVAQVIGKIEADTFIDSEEFFKSNIVDEIPVENGILNVKTQELSPFTPEKIFFTKLPVKYDKDAKCEMIDKFLSDVLREKEDKNVFYEIAGFGLYKEYFIEKAIMFVGNGRNGKSKALELLKRLYGAENCKNIPLSCMRQDDTIVSELFGKLMNLAGDLSSKQIEDTGMFKSLVGRDLISAKRKYLKSISFINYAKMAFACNELPRVKDYSDGFWDRWLLFQFPYKFTTQEEIDNASETDKKRLKLIDTNIIEKITTDEELSGLLNAALEGLQRLIKNQNFSYTIGTSEIKNIWIRKSDSFMAFCIDNIEEDYEGYITKKDLRKYYSKYCKKHRTVGVSDKMIKSTLEETFGAFDERKNTSPHVQESCWSGVKFKFENTEGTSKVLEFLKYSYKIGEKSKNFYEILESVKTSSEEIKSELEKLLLDGKIYKVKEGVFSFIE